MNITKKQILRDIILGMDPYLTTGVPEVYWDLAITLTREFYGESGVGLLEAAHKTYDDSVDSRDEIIVHSLELWTDGNTRYSPDMIFDALEAGNHSIRHYKER